MITYVKSKKEMQDIISSNENVVVDFFANWCGPCKMLGAVLESLSEKHLNVQFVKVDVDLLQDVAMDFDIYSIPDVYFFKNGKQVNVTSSRGTSKSLLGFVDEDEFEFVLSKTFNI